MFQLPIEYIHDIYPISDDIKEDLELISTKDASMSSIYSLIFNPQTSFGEKCISKWSQYYTTDKAFLKDSKNLYQNYEFKLTSDKINVFYKKWREIHDDNGFNNKYHFINWDYLNFLNDYEFFLQGLSMYNLGSPIINLIIPIIMLIVPFFMLKLLKKPVSFDNYKTIVYNQIKNHVLGKLVTQFSEVKTSQKIYLSMMASIYLFNTYQNVITCLQYYKNFTTIHDIFYSATYYFDDIISHMSSLSDYLEDLPTYIPFRDIMNKNMAILQNFNEKIKQLIPLRIGQIFNIGTKMNLLYRLKHDKELREACEFSFELFGYLDNILGLQEQLHKKYMHFGKFHKQYTKFKKLYYPSLVNNKPIKNNIVIKNNSIISGPNASGKTTFLKSVLLNLLFTQQIYCGFYEEASIKPYHYFHCYLNIPDTCGRDSLFQAEARRCKTFLDIIVREKDKHHFCIFDELYSGTNPHEAVGSAFAYLSYIANLPNVEFMLTTHFIDLCDRLERNNLSIQNYLMKSEILDNQPVYFYKLKKGISTIKCGFHVLKNLHYPDTIVNDAFSFN